MKKTYIRILNPIYPFKIHVFLGYSVAEEINKEVKCKSKSDTKIIHERIKDLDFTNVHGYCVESLGHIFIIVKTYEHTSNFYDVLHHEITHAVFKSAFYIGIDHTIESEEFYSYMHGFITNQIYKKILN